MVDTALITIYERDRPEREVPDFAPDMHTTKGRALHRRCQSLLHGGGGHRECGAGPASGPVLEEGLGSASEDAVRGR